MPESMNLSTTSIFVKAARALLAALQALPLKDTEYPAIVAAAVSSTPASGAAKAEVVTAPKAHMIPNFSFAFIALNFTLIGEVCKRCFVTNFKPSGEPTTTKESSPAGEPAELSNRTL